MTPSMSRRFETEGLVDVLRHGLPATWTRVPRYSLSSDSIIGQPRRADGLVVGRFFAMRGPSSRLPSLGWLEAVALSGLPEGPRSKKAGCCDDCDRSSAGCGCGSCKGCGSGRKCADKCEPLCKGSPHGGRALDPESFAKMASHGLGTDSGSATGGAGQPKPGSSLGLRGMSGAARRAKLKAAVQGLSDVPWSRRPETRAAVEKLLGPNVVAPGPDGSEETGRKRPFTYERPRTGAGIRPHPGSIVDDIREVLSNRTSVPTTVRSSLDPRTSSATRLGIASIGPQLGVARTASNKSIVARLRSALPEHARPKPIAGIETALKSGIERGFVSQQGPVAAAVEASFHGPLKASLLNRGR